MICIQEKLSCGFVCSGARSRCQYCSQCWAEATSCSSSPLVMEDGNRTSHSALAAKLVCAVGWCILCVFDIIFPTSDECTGTGM